MFSIIVSKLLMWKLNIALVNNIVRSKYILVENNKIEILFSNYIFGLTFQSSSSKKPGIFGIKSLESKSEYIVRK